VRILIVGSSTEIVIERLYSKYLVISGTETEIFPINDRVRDKSASSIWFKIALRLHAFFVLKKVNAELFNHINEFKPDVVWVFKGMYVLPKTLESIKKDVLLVNYNPDHPFLFSSRGSGNRNVTKSIGLYNLHLCYHLGVKQKIEEQYKIKTAVLPFGFELSQEHYNELLEQEEIKRVCFIGNPDSTRIETIDFIASSGIKIDVYGHGWENTLLKKNINVSIFDALYGFEFWKALRRYRVQLNIFREHNIGSHNMRTFEIPACGGMQLAPYSEEQASFFKENEEIFFYHSKRELLQSIEKLLSADSEEINKYRFKARERSLNSGYSYDSRSRLVNTILLENRINNLK
jgi:spore maturation protein CgeB